jgi:hypothetical protein
MLITLLVFALAVTFFEREANQLLGVFFYGRKSLYDIEWWSMSKKMVKIFSLNLIEKDAYDKILEIVRIRNRLVHPSEREDQEGRKNDLFLRFRLSEAEKDSLLSFKECYSRLLEADSKLWKGKFGDKSIEFP